MRAAIYGEVVGAVRENEDVLIFTVKAEIPDGEPINTIVWAENSLARYLRSERLNTGAKVVCMGQMSAENNFPYLAAEHVAFDIYEEWAKANER